MGQQGPELIVLRSATTLDAACSLGDGRRLLFYTEGSLLLADEGELVRARPGSPAGALDLARLVSSRRLASGLPGASSFSVHLSDRQVVLALPGDVLERVVVDHPEKRTRVILAGLPGELGRATLSPDGRWALCETSMWDDKKLEASHHLFAVDLQGTRAPTGSSLTAQERLDVEWFSRQQAFVVYDIAGDRLWRWSPPKKPVALGTPSRKDRRVSGAWFVPREDRIVWCETDESERCHLRWHGLVPGKGGQPSPVLLAEGDHDSLAPHPGKDRVALHHSAGDLDRLCILTTGGKPVVEQPVVSTAVGVALIWLGDGRTLLSVGKEALALFGPLS